MWTNLAKKIERRTFKIQQLRFIFSVGVEKYLSNSNNNSTTMMHTNNIREWLTFTGKSLLGKLESGFYLDCHPVAEFNCKRFRSDVEGWKVGRFAILGGQSEFSSYVGGARTYLELYLILLTPRSLGILPSWPRNVEIKSPAVRDYSITRVPRLFLRLERFSSIEKNRKILLHSKFILNFKIWQIV